jgi:L-ribulose-5-phosphate 4-epimerase
MLEALKTQVCRANLELVEKGLVIETFGNVSGVDRERGRVVIKPSGVAYSGMRPRHMVVVSLATGEVVEGKLRPSSDTPTHLELYRAFANVGGVVHTHSLYATAWAQARQGIPAYGTTQADYWYGAVPCTRPMRRKEIQKHYEANTAKVIVERLRGRDPLKHPAVLVASHGPFTWGVDPADAVHHAYLLEYVARLASETVRINPRTPTIPAPLLDKHFLRKHGPQAYYGQR